MSPHRIPFLNYCGWFLLVLLGITLILSWIAGLSPIGDVHWSMRDLGIGVIAALGMVLVFGFVPSVRDQAEQLLGAPLSKCSWYDLAILAALVGTIEELLFRGVLEPWVARIDPMFAFIAVNLFFGMLHSVSILYAVIATLLGGILSLLAHGPGEFNLFRPIVAHSVYDFIGFVILANRYRRLRKASQE